MLQKLRKDHCDATKIISGHEETNKLRAYSTKKKKRNTFPNHLSREISPEAFSQIQQQFDDKERKRVKKKKK